MRKSLRAKNESCELSTGAFFPRGRLMEAGAERSLRVAAKQFSRDPEGSAPLVNIRAEQRWRFSIREPGRGTRRR